MKKKLLLTLGLLIIVSTFSTAISKTNVSSELAEAIKMYKAGNYSQCYVKLDSAIAKDPGNALCYYYKAISSAQIGKKAEAISNYEKVLSLAPEGNNLYRYARKGKTCLETPEKCNETTQESAEDRFIKSRSAIFSDQVKGEYERLKIDEMRRTINRSDDIEPARFRDYKDFSSMNVNDGNPSNDEIVAAIKVLQKAGLYNTNINTAYSDLSLLTGNNYGGFNMNEIGNLNPQLIQTMLTNNMSLGF